MGPAGGNEKSFGRTCCSDTAAGFYPSVASEHVDEFVEDDTEDDEVFLE